MFSGFIPPEVRQGETCRLLNNISNVALGLVALHEPPDGTARNAGLIASQLAQLQSDITSAASRLTGNLK